MQESKDIGTHITTREELDTLYKNIQTEEKTNALSENQEK